MTITPITPIDREKLVPISTSILIDFTGTPTLVLVDTIVVFDGSFQAGWTGSLLNKPFGGKRLILDPPSDFALGAVVDVDVTEDGTVRLVYVFEAGTTRITSTDDASSPRVVETGVSPAIEPYVAYVREPGDMYLRQDEPLTPEIKVVEGSIVDIGWDPTLGKLIVFFVNNGKIFVTTADPGDGPTSLTQPSALTTRYLSGGAAAGRQAAFSSADFPPIKILTPIDQYIGGIGAAGRQGTYTGFPSPVTPAVISISPTIVRFPRPSQESSKSLVLGFIPLKFTKEAMRRLAFVPIADGQSHVDFTDPVDTPGARYAAIVVYTRGENNPGLVESPRGGSAAVLTDGLDIYLSSGGSSGAVASFTSEDFPPLKLLLPVDEYINTTASSGRSFAFTSTGFPPIGVG